MPTWCCPTPPISSATTASSLLDRPISEPDARRGRASAGRWSSPDRDVRALPVGAARPRRAPRAARLGRARRQPALQATMPTTSSATSAGPASARWPACAARTATQERPRRAQPGPARALHRERLLLAARTSRPRRSYFKPATAPTRTGRSPWASPTRRSPTSSSSIASRCRNSGSRPRAMARASRRSTSASASRALLRPLPVWYPPLRRRRRRGGLPAPRRHPAPDGDVPLLGLAERLAAADPRRERALRPGPVCEALGFGTATGSRVDSRARPHQGAGGPHGRRRTRHGLDLERHRQARRRLGARPRRAGSHQGFLLNHLIPDRCRPARPALVQLRPGHRPGRLVRPARADRANAPTARTASPSRLSRCADPAGRHARSAPRDPRCATSASEGRAMTRLPASSGRRSSAWSSTSTPASAARPASSTARNGTPAAHSAPLSDRPLRRRRRRASGSTASTAIEAGGAATAARVHFPQVLPALRDAGLRHRLPDRRLLQARRGRHRAGQRGQLHRLRPVRLGLPLWRARDGRGSRRDEEMHALRRPHLQRRPRPRRTACPPAC